MAYPISAGSPALTGTAIPNYFAPKWLIEWYEQAIVMSICNTDYEGQIKNQGDKVTIRSLPSTTSRAHAKGQELTYDVHEIPTVDLLVDKGRSWGFEVDDVDELQADLSLLDGLAAHHVKTLQEDIHELFFADIYSSAHANNSGLTAGIRSAAYSLGVAGTPLGFSTTTALDILTRCKAVLDEQKVPTENRWAVLPTWAIYKLMNSELREANKMGDAKSTYRNGNIGAKIAGFDVYQSNQLEIVTDGADQVTNAIFGHKSAVCFPTQLLKTEGPITLPNKFAKIMRGLQVYGYEAVKPEGLGHLYIKAA